MLPVKQFISFIITILLLHTANAQHILIDLHSPILFKGSEQVAYRDPAVLYNKGIFYLFFTYIRGEDGNIYSYTAMSKSRDLKNWSPIKIITPRGQDLDFSSPGNVIRFKHEWIMCLQTYPRPGYKVGMAPEFGNGDARLYTMRSKDLAHWSTPELLKVKGPLITFASMGRMIDPYLIEDRKQPGKWWCFFKQDGMINMSFSYDLQSWVYTQKVDGGGENPCVIYKNGEYIMFYSPKNGIGIKKSTDLVHWISLGEPVTLGQANWPWAKGRLTAGAVIDLTANKKFGCYLLFFHGSGPSTEEQGDFDKNASLGIAWSKDLVHWDWPGK